MNRIELRGEARRTFTEPPKGIFTVITGGIEHPVTAVHDVSSSGIRVQVSQALGVATHVSVHYRHDRLDLNLNGITCWEMPVDGEAGASRMVGIDLLTPTVLFTLL